MAHRIAVLSSVDGEEVAMWTWRLCLDDQAMHLYPTQPRSGVLSTLCGRTTLADRVQRLEVDERPHCYFCRAADAQAADSPAP
jgi:hypothetical protein